MHKSEQIKHNDNEIISATAFLQAEDTQLHKILYAITKSKFVMQMGT